jgi:glucosamine-6-phosphate deaminase
VTIEQWRVRKLAVRAGSDTAEIAAAAARQAASVLATAVAARGAANAMFATGNSQLAFLAELGRQGDVPWERVTAFHMDEYVGLAPDHPASFRRYIRERIADAVHPASVHYVDGSASDPAAECHRYSGLLRAHPLDLCCMGIGENGHLAFNDPGVADFADPEDLKVVELDEACRRQQVGEGHFPSVDAVPRFAITVTIPALLRAGTVVVVCPEERKAPAVRAALEGPVSTACPASILTTREHATLYVDAGSASLLAADGGSAGPSQRSRNG